MTQQSLPFAPLHKNPSGTSRTAAQESAENMAGLREQVYQAILARGPDGMTCDEAIALFAAKHDHQSISPRFVELHQAFRILRSGKQRRTRKKRWADVMVAITHAPPTLIHDEKLQLLVRYESALLAGLKTLRALRAVAPVLVAPTDTQLGWLVDKLGGASDSVEVLRRLLLESSTESPRERDSNA